MKKACSAALAVYGASAIAAVPADVTSAIAEMKTDAVAVAVAVTVAIIAVMAIKFIRKGM